MLFFPLVKQPLPKLQVAPFATGQLVPDLASAHVGDLGDLGAEQARNRTRHHLGPDLPLAVSTLQTSDRDAATPGQRQAHET